MKIRHATQDMDLTYMVDLINRVYQVAEEGLWADGYQRTYPQALAESIARGEIIVAQETGRIRGVVRLLESGVAGTEFGMLAVEENYRGRGFGRDLVRHVEDLSRNLGKTFIQLLLVMPRDWEHEGKKALAEWYQAMGYVFVDSSPFEPEHDLASRRVPCMGWRYRKPL